MTIHVLFLCPHSAGKSVFAATYFRAAAACVGLDVTAHVAGTDPDDIVMPNVRQALEAQGFVVDDEPHLLTLIDAARADIVINIGCTPGEIPRGDAETWDVPMLSEDFAGSMHAIFERAEALVRRLETGTR